ncbi:hypothetical protein YA0850_34705 [Pseudomonas veronii]|jgi:DNA-binding IclR family transcriptional regulator|uniref:IclR-ED domain-containing protein n=2 Tax=Pseudomonas veronii TaxID=76761 RepID=A0ABS0VQS2_PSEVE|nr:hypothetical protein [Pseudomonas veronii]MBI6653412.1 hypothetical protein [Pseudomonas veronii]HBO1428286.1 hypothetical protein [Pseudomonas aeruginosa]
MSLAVRNNTPCTSVIQRSEKMGKVDFLLLDAQLEQAAAQSLMVQLEAIRKNGISSDHCEHIEGITTTTVALDTVLGRFAISMPIPTFRFERKRVNYIEELLRRKAGLLKEIGIDG